MRSPLPPLRVLLIEDNPHDKTEIKSLLLRGSDRRYSFIEAATGAEGLRLCHGDPPDCVILDDELPDMTAIEILAELPRLAGDSTQGPAVPVVVLTGSIDRNLSRSVIRAGAHDFVCKSWMNAGSLTRAVESAAERLSMAADLWRATRALAEREARLRGTFEAMAEGLLRLDASGVILECNPAAEHILARPSEQILGLTCPDLFPCAAGSLRDQMIEILHPDGERRWLQLNQTHLREAGGDFLITFTDVTEHRRNEELNRSLMNGSTDCVKVLDLEGRVLHMNNPGMIQMEIEDFGSLCGNPWSSLWPSEARESVCESIASARSGNVSSFQAFCPTAKGTPKWWEVTVSPVRDSVGGQIVRLLSVSRDVSEARKAQETLRENESRLRQALEAERWARGESERVARAKDEFLATLSHELRTPLNAIVGWAEILKRGGGSAGLVQEGIGVIARNAKAQSQLISDLLDMNRIMSGKLKMEIGPIMPNLIAAAAVETVRPAIETKKLRLDLHLGEGLPQIQGDPNRLQQILWNLLSNAVKFTPAGGTIRLETSSGESQVRFVVEDDGKGIEAEFLPYLFDRFSQADASAARQHGGLGLGLSIVKQLVDLHGGQVTAESEGPERGSRFIVALPVAPDVFQEDFTQNPLAPTLVADLVSPGSEREENLSGLSVLVVDDQPDALELARRLLAECGAAVSTASSAQAALDRLSEERPQVLISDLGMPEMDGYRLIREIREQLGWGPSELPAAALTAFARPEDRDRAFAAGYQAHLSKPLRPQQLITTVATLARAAKQERNNRPAGT